VGVGWGGPEAGRGGACWCKRGEGEEGGWVGGGGGEEKKRGSLILNDIN